MGGGSNDRQVNDGDRVPKWLTDKKLPHHAGSQVVRVHEHAEARLNPGVLFRVTTLVLDVEDRSNCACRRYAIESFEGVFLNNSPVGGDDGKNRLAGTVRRWAEKSRPHRA